MDDLKIAIDASRLDSGGGLAHLLGVLDIADPSMHRIREIHVWGSRKLLGILPDHVWLIKHNPPAYEKSIPALLLWQATRLAGEIRKAGCQILFAVDGITLCRFKPMVTLNHSLLPFEDRIMPLYGQSKERWRLRVLAAIQTRVFRFADSVIFLTHYAQELVQRHTGPLADTVVIAHGVGEEFKRAHPPVGRDLGPDRPIRCLYVSPLFEYKYNWKLVGPIAGLRARGLDITLDLVGGVGRARAKAMLDRELMIHDPGRTFVKVHDFLPHDEIVRRVAQADIFLFASGCETFGIALLEAMAAGAPIACSNRSSLPETLQDGGEYFDPEDAASIAAAIDRLVQDPARRQALAVRAWELARQYSWTTCAALTWQFVARCHDRFTGRLA